MDKYRERFLVYYLNLKLNVKITIYLFNSKPKAPNKHNYLLELSS